MVVPALQFFRKLGYRAGIEPGEGRLVARLATVFGLYVFVLLLGRTVRDALFLNAGLSRSLPAMYMGVALGIIVSSLVARRFLKGRADVQIARRLAAGFAVVFASIYGLIALNLAMEPALYALYLWVEIAGALLMVQFWSVANDCFDPRQAKRLYSLIAAGQVGGNLACGFVAGWLASRIGTEVLLLTISAALLLSNVLFQVTDRRGELAGAGAMVRPARYRDTTAARKLIATLVVLSAMTYTVTSLVDFQFKLDASRRYTQDELTQFFGLFYGSLGAAAFLVQVVLSRLLVRSIGLFGTMALMPAGFVLAGGLRGSGGGFWSGAALKADEHLLRHTLNEPLSQLLVIPLPSHRKRDVQQILGAVVKPAAIGLAGLVLVGLTRAQSPDAVVPLVASVVTLVSAGWLAVLYILRKQYVGMLGEAAQRFQRMTISEADSLSQDRAARELSRLMRRESRARTLEVALTAAEQSRWQLDSVALCTVIGNNQLPQHVRGRALVLLGRGQRAVCMEQARELLDSGFTGPLLVTVARVVLYGFGEDVDTLHVKQVTALGDPWLLELLLIAVSLRRQEGLPVPDALLSAIVDAARDRLQDEHLDTDSFARLAQLIAPDDLASDAWVQLGEARTERDRRKAEIFCDRLWYTRLNGWRRHIALAPRERLLAEHNARFGSGALRSAAALARLESGDGSHWREQLAVWPKVRNAMTLQAVWQECQMAELDPPVLESLIRPLSADLLQLRRAWPQLAVVDPRPWLEDVSVWLAQALPRHTLLRSSWQYALHTRVLWLLRWSAARSGSTTLSGMLSRALLAHPASRTMLTEVLDEELGRDGYKAQLIGLIEALGHMRDAPDDLLVWQKSPWSQSETIHAMTGLHILRALEEQPMEIIERIVHLSGGDLFTQLPIQSLEKIAENCESLHYARGQHILAEGAEGDGLYVLVEGEVEVQRNGEALKRLGRGTCFGEISLLDDQPIAADIVAALDCFCLRISRSDFEVLLVEEPPFARTMMAGFAARLRGKGGARG